MSNRATEQQYFPYISIKTYTPHKKEQPRRHSASVRLVLAKPQLERYEEEEGQDTGARGQEGLLKKHKNPGREE